MNTIDETGPKMTTRDTWDISKLSFVYKMTKGTCGLAETCRTHNTKIFDVFARVFITE